MSDLDPFEEAMEANGFVRLERDGQVIFYKDGRAIGTDGKEVEVDQSDIPLGVRVPLSESVFRKVDFNPDPEVVRGINEIIDRSAGEYNPNQDKKGQYDQGYDNQT